MPRFGPGLSAGILVFIVSLAGSTWEFPLSSDGAAMLATADSLLERRTLAIDAHFAFDTLYAPSAKQGTNGLAYSKYGIGLPIIEIPLLGLADVVSGSTGVVPSRVKSAVLSMLNPLLTAFAAVLVFSMCERLGVSRAGTRLAALGYAFATLAWVHAATDFTEPLQACSIALSAWALVVFDQNRRDWALWASGAALAWAVLTKTATAVLAAPFLVGACLACRSHGASWPGAMARSIKLAAPVAVSVAAVGLLNWVHFGSVTDSGYNTPVLTHPLGGGLFGLLLSPTKGIVFYAPLVLLVPLGTVTLWRRSRSVAVAIALGAIAWAAVNALFYNWGGGWCWGPRYLLPILPLACVAVGLATDRSRASGIARALCAAGFIINLLGVVVSEEAYRRTTMRLWLADDTGYVTAGDTLVPGETVTIPNAPEDVLAPFSSISGHWWLARVALAGCDCSATSAACACRAGEFADNRVFRSPPWIARFPDAIPLPPYGISIIRPVPLRELYRAVFVDPDRQP